MPDDLRLSRRTIAGSGAMGGSAFLLGALLGRDVFAQSATPTDATASPVAAMATPNGVYAPQTGIEREELVIGVQSLPATLDPA